jgi:hypothetical protein
MKIRQARRCSARRRSGDRCHAFAITGGWVCAAHGGRAPQVRAAARQRVIMAQLERGLNESQRMHERRVEAWHEARREQVAELLGIPVENVNRAALLRCWLRHGRPNIYEDPPEFRWDRRFGPRSLW